MFDAAKTETALLEVNNIEVIYNHVILVLKGVSLSLAKGGITALLGGNGAGKTTTLKAISNLLRSERGEVTKGTILYRGESVQELNPSELVMRGVIQVMEGRRGKPAHRRLHAQGWQCRDRRGSRDGLSVFSPPEGTPPFSGRLYLGRRAADGGDRQGVDEPAGNHPA